MADTVTFYRPGTSFPAFSVTGARCELQCDHCRGRYLRGMRPLRSPEELESAAMSLASRGGRGLLLSGGCDLRGRVPLSPYLGKVRALRESTGLQFNLHTGLVDAEEAAALLDSGADAYSVDVLQDARTITGPLHLRASPRDYARTVRLLAPGGRLVPHVCVGLQSEQGEEDTLELLSSVPMAALIVLGLVLPNGAPGNAATERVVRFIARAVERTGAPVLLGCMRPRGDRSLEIKALEAGAAGVVNPSSETLRYAEARGTKIAVRETCCALHR